MGASGWVFLSASHSRMMETIDTPAFFCVHASWGRIQHLPHGMGQVLKYYRLHEHSVYSDGLY